MSVIDLRTPKLGYKPFRYPKAYEFWKKQQQAHWLVDEVPMAEDAADWANRLTEGEKHLLSQIFRFFTQSDIDVNDNYMEKYSRVFKPNEVKMMLSAFSNIETVHIDAYAKLLETISMPDEEFSAFMEYEEMKNKHDYLQGFNVDTDEDVLLTLAMFGAFTEGLQLFASFAMLMNFPRFNKMKGMGQVVTWSIRDESLHCEGIIWLFHEMVKQLGGLKPETADKIYDCCRSVVTMEDKFIDLAFDIHDISGMNPEQIKNYIRYVADWRLQQLGLKPIYGVTKHPLPWLQEMLNGVEHANFFEARATEYSKGATQGDWGSVWTDHDTL